MIYSGENAVPEEISFAKNFFEGASTIDIRVKTLSREDAKTISGLYIGFCKILDVQRKIYADKLECIKETLSICSEKSYLVPYLKNHEKEAVTMMSELFDEEYLRKQYDNAEWKKSFAEGKAEGKAEGESKAIKSIAEKLREMGLSDEQIIKATSI